MKTSSNGGPERYYEHVNPPPMSLRDWLAGQALAGLCANSGGPFQANAMDGWGLCNCDFKDVGEMCRTLADATLAALNRAGEAREGGTEPAS